ncbi:MAG: SPFH domain-containing protein [Acidobacteriota bacterium]|nr:SPFH domain-containing protein [Acidobacteriota bacterium]
MSNTKFEGLSVRAIVIIVIILMALLFGRKVVRTIPAGYVGVPTLFGSVQDKPYKSGFHVVNPLYKWTLYDVRQKTHVEKSMVPTQDQLQTTIDISVQWRLISASTPSILENTGVAEQMIDVHLVPKLRSVIREQGKSIKRAEDFFLNETQERLQSIIQTELSIYLEPKGMEIQAVLIRDISLPEFITRAIEQKKEREQAVEKQKAELERYKTEQEQQIAMAVAKRRAAEEEAAQVKVLADARAYEIQKLNDAVGRNPSYIKLQAIEALKAISKDPASKIYFMDGQSPNPLPLLHLGDPEKK